MTASFRENLYQFLSEHLHQFGTTPSFADMTAAMGISPRSKSLITRNLRALEKEGRVVLTKNERRLLISFSSKELPLLGRISAGPPIEAIADC
jgi:SOS-response transcriptional repressor LexA